MKINPKALVLVAHPSLKQSTANRIICENLQLEEDIVVHNLYDHYPYFHIDVKREQELLRAHNLIVFQHPFFWYSMPALLKLWMDEVLTSGFAYGSNGEALRNKHFLLSITTGSDFGSYSDSGTHSHSIEQFLIPYKQISQLCQMNWCEPKILFSSRKTESSEIKTHAEQLIKLIHQIRTA